MDQSEQGLVCLNMSKVWFGEDERFGELVLSLLYITQTRYQLVRSLESRTVHYSAVDCTHQGTVQELNIVFRSKVINLVKCKHF